MKNTYRIKFNVSEFRKYFKYDKRGFLVRKLKDGRNSYIGETTRGHSFGNRGTKNKYRSLWFKGKSLPFHVAVFAVVHGRFPKNDIDHKDRDRTNNKIGNLRDATRSQNCLNKSLSKRNSSGYAGIFYLKRDASWMVQLVVNHKRHYLGCFKSKSEAVKTQKAFILKHHKEFRAT